MKRKITLFFILLLLTGLSIFLYDYFSDNGNLVVEEVQENNLSDEGKEWFKESCKNKGANIYEEKTGECTKYYLYFEQTGQINYCKYVVDASLKNNTLIFKIKEKKVNHDSKVSQNVLVCTKPEKEPNKILIYLNGEEIEYNN